MSTPPVDTYRRHVDRAQWRPRSVVWELTLACNLRCRHCGSRAGRPLAKQLSLETCLRIADELADFGTELVTLSGGEPTLFAGWEVLAARLNARGIQTNMVTNGVYRDPQGAERVARAALAAGMPNVGVSLDGLCEVHEAIRGPGTFAKTVASIRTFLEHQLSVAVITSVNALNFPILEEVYAFAREIGVQQWRIQLAKPMGNLDDDRGLTLSPLQYAALIPLAARLKRNAPIHVCCADSIGYFGPHEPFIRDSVRPGASAAWAGCQAGMQVLGIESDGTIKGCLSLQAHRHGQDDFAEGNLRTASLRELWYRPGSFAYNRDYDPASATGACRGCKHAKRCKGGARCVAVAFTGDPAADPYCYYALTERATQRTPLQHTAAAMAAGLLIGWGAAACATPTTEADVTPTERQEPAPAPTSDAVDPAAPDLMPAPPPEVYTEYGISPEVIRAIDTLIVPAYGVIPPMDPEVPLLVAPDPPPSGLTTIPQPEPDPHPDLPAYGVSPPPYPPYPTPHDPDAPPPPSPPDLSDPDLEVTSIPVGIPDPTIPTPAYGVRPPPRPPQPPAPPTPTPPAPPLPTPDDSDDAEDPVQPDPDVPERPKPMPAPAYGVRPPIDRPPLIPAPSEE